ncbi:tetratricopeptide repeat protein [Fervidobacterium sp.]
MKILKLTLIFLLLSIFCLISFSQNSNSVNNIEYFTQKFVNARSLKNIEELKNLLSLLENEIKNGSNKSSNYEKIRTLLSEVYFEYGQLLNDNKLKERYYNLALQSAKDIIKTAPENGKAYYIAAMSSAALIDFVNVFQKLQLMNDFDFYIERAIKYTQDNLDKAIAYIAKGVRFMNPPWPFYDYKKAEDSFKEAEKYVSNYSGLYLNWGQLYLKMGDKKRAEEMLSKVLIMEPHPFFMKQHEDNVIIAKQLLGMIK